MVIADVPGWKWNNGFFSIGLIESAGMQPYTTEYIVPLKLTRVWQNPDLPSEILHFFSGSPQENENEFSGLINDKINDSIWLIFPANELMLSFSIAQFFYGK